jgi:predicted metal-dependent hydrolase
MKDLIQLGDIKIEVDRKAIKNVHLSVHPPDGRVTMSAPLSTRLEVARAYAITKLAWIRQQQVKMTKQLRETPRQYVQRETHYIWGRRYLLRIIHTEDKAYITLDHKRITLYVKPGSSRQKREELMYEWQKLLLHDFIREVIPKWEKILGVNVNAYYVQRMKTKWGSCNHRSGNIRLNTELVKKPKDLVEYVIVHEMAHLLFPTHSENYVALMNRFYPGWREARMELNDLPLGYVEWKNM